MKFKEIYLEVNSDVIEALYPLLEEEGIQGWKWMEKGSRVSCLFYLPANRNWKEKCEKIKTKIEGLSEFGLETGSVYFNIKEIDSQSWEKLIKAAGEPRQVLEGLWIIPPEYSKKEFPEGLVIKLRGGMAFGTGDHPSTRLALGLIRDWFQNRKRILDLGTGSGILALLAACLGAREVIGVDNDLEAITLARENVKLNKLEEKVKIKEGNLLQGLKGPYTGIIINILYPQIVSVLPDLDQITDPRAGVILSGILFKQLTQLREEIAQTPWEIIDTRVEGDWAGIYLEKKG